MVEEGIVKKEESEEMDLIAKAHMAAERLEKANSKNEELIKKMESIESRRLLGGKTEAGSTTTQKTEEEIKKEKTKEFWAGSEIAKAIDKYG